MGYVNLILCLIVFFLIHYLFYNAQYELISQKDVESFYHKELIQLLKTKALPPPTYSSLDLLLNVPSFFPIIPYLHTQEIQTKFVEKEEITPIQHNNINDKDDEFSSNIRGFIEAEIFRNSSSLNKNERNERREIVLTAMESSYLEVGLNYLISLDKLGIDNVLIISLDLETYNFLKQHGFNSYYVFSNYKHIPRRFSPKKPGDFKYMEILKVRVYVYYEVLSLGYDIIYSDVDTVFLSNPFPYLPREYDWIAMSGIWPPELNKIWGSTLNGGFGYIKSNENNILFMHEVLRRITNDDQYIINIMMNEKGVEIHEVACTIDHSEYLHNHDHIKKLSSKLFPQNSKCWHSVRPIKVYILNNYLFPTGCRIPLPLSTDVLPVVVHASCTSKDSDSKKFFFQTYGFWFLKDNWKSVSFKNHMTISSYLSAIHIPPRSSQKPPSAQLHLSSSSSSSSTETKTEIELNEYSSSNQPQYLIVGFHPYALSIVTSLLKKFMGIYIGDPDKDFHPFEAHLHSHNVLGTYERKDVESLNRYVVKIIGKMKSEERNLFFNLTRKDIRHIIDEGFEFSSETGQHLYQKISPKILSLISSFGTYGERVVQKMNQHQGAWMISSVDFCHTLPLWTSLLHNPHIIFVLTHPLEASTQVLRHSPHMNPNTAIELWASCSSRIHSQLQSKQSASSVLYFPYSRFLTSSFPEFLKLVQNIKLSRSDQYLPSINKDEFQKIYQKMSDLIFKLNEDGSQSTVSKTEMTLSQSSLYKEILSLADMSVHTINNK